MRLKARLVLPFCSMCICLVFPYHASTKCLWHEATGIVMGGQNRCIGSASVSASVSFSIHLNMWWCSTVAKKPHWLCFWVPRRACAFGWRPSALTGPRGADWPKYIVLTSSGTHPCDASCATLCQIKWFTSESQLGRCSVFFYLFYWREKIQWRCPLSYVVFKGASGVTFDHNISETGNFPVSWPQAEPCWL